MDAIMKLIKETLPNLSQETLENVKEKLVDIGVSDVDDMQLVQEQDLSDVLKPIQIRKITQLRIAAKSFQTHELSLNKDDSSGNLSDKSDSLFDSPSTSRCSTPSDTEITPSQKPRRESNTAKPTSVPKTANWVANFKIPWHKFPKAILEACENKVRPQPKYRREMVRILCEEIQQHCAFPGRKTLSKIAETVVEKYTESFQDELGGSVVGSGFESFRKQMEERLYNELRKDNKSVSLTMRLNTSRDDNSTPKGKTGKQPISDSYGCVNWQPDSFPQNESDGSQKEKEEWLISEFPKKDRDMEKVSLFMKQTYASQRLLINRSKPNVPSIMEIKDQWPFLFETDMMLQHFEELMGFNLQVILQRSLEEKASVIYDFMKQEHPSKKKVRESLLEIDTAMALDESKIPQMAGVYLLVLAYFGEPEDMMIRSYDETATVEDVVSDSKIPSTPFIAVFGEVLEAKRCGLVVDEVMVNQSINGITEGMMMLFASYFVLNIMYPNEVAATLEFIQRCFVDINPNRGNKRAKTKGKQHTVNPKVLSLANCLKDHASQWVL